MHKVVSRGACSPEFEDERAAGRCVIATSVCNPIKVQQSFDADARHLYVARSTRVMVVDVDNGKLVGEIPNTTGVHGVALIHKLGRGISSNGRDDSATIFDLKTLAPIATVKTGAKPDAILFEEFSGLVLTFDGKSNDVTVIDPEKALALGAIALPGRPETGVSDGQGKVFVNLEDKNLIAVIDVVARKALTSCLTYMGETRMLATVMFPIVSKRISAEDGGWLRRKACLSWQLSQRWFPYPR